MTLTNWLRTRPAKAPRQPARSPRPRLAVEPLEGREVPATLSVAEAPMVEGGSPSALVAPGSGGLSVPQDLTVGPDGSLYVVSNSTNSVIRYNAATGQPVGTFVAAGSGGLSNPFGLAFGPDGNLYVGSQGASTVFRYSGTTGAFLSTFVAAGSGGLNLPRGLVFGADGNLYVSSRESDAVLRFQGPAGPAPGSPLPAAGQPGAAFVTPGSGGLDAPQNLVFGPDQSLYVASTDANAAVLRFDGATGGFLGTTVATGGGGLAVPRGLAFDPDGRLYVADWGTGAVHRYAPQGQYLDDPVAAGAATVRVPVGMTFDAQGALLLCSRDTNAVVRYDGGAVVTLSAASPTPVSVGYATADGTATAGSDYTAQTGTVTFAPGQTTRRVLLATHDDLLFNGARTLTVQLSNPTGGATVAAGTGTVTIADDDAARQVSVADSSAIEGDSRAHYRGAFAQDVPGSTLGLPAFGPDGSFYTVPLAGPSAGGIDQYDGTTGAFVRHLVPVGRLNGGRDMGFRGGSLFIGEEYNDDVLQFNATTGAFEKTFVAAGSGGLDGPHGLTFGPDANGDGVPELYVTGRNSGNVVRYDGATGQPLGTYVAPGSGGLSYPEGLTFDPAGTSLYVASTGTNQVLRYNAQTGAYLGVAAAAGLASPHGVKFGPDGLLYVASGGNNRIERFTAGGTYVDDYVPAGSGGMINPSRLVFGPDGDAYVSVGGPNADGSRVYRFGTENEAVFTVSLSTPSSLALTVDYATADGSALAGSDYTATAGTLTFGPGITSKTVRVPLVNDAVVEPTEAFSLNLSNPLAASVARGQGVGTITDDDGTKFYVVDDGSTDRTYRYGAPGNGFGNSPLSTGDTAPRGAASTAAGDKVWVVDANKTVYVYNAAGGLLGSWAAGGLSGKAQLEGITTDGTDVWLLDNRAHAVYRYAGAAARLSGSQSAAGSFVLNSANANAKDLVTDGASVWVVNDGTADAVFKYTAAGGLLGSWTIDAADASPTGITLDPTGASQSLWVVDGGSDKVYEYAGARPRTSGGQAAAATFALAAGNTNPQGIADPPAGPADPAPAAGTAQTAADWSGAAVLHGALVDPPAGRGGDRPAADPAGAAVAVPPPAATWGGPPAAVSRLAADWLDDAPAGPPAPLGRAKRS